MSLQKIYKEIKIALDYTSFGIDAPDKHNSSDGLLQLCCMTPSKVQCENKMESNCGFC